MLTIRLTRKGKKNQPFFRVVLIDKRRSTKGGRAVEDLGYVDPLKKRRSFNKERIQYWISKGAQTSDTIHNLLVSEKIIEGKKIHVSKLSKKKLAEMETKKTEEAQKTADAKKAEEAKKTAEAEAKKAEKEAEKAEAEPSESPADNQAGEKPAEPVEESTLVEEVKAEEPEVPKEEEAKEVKPEESVE
ncbi:MAG: 30S ribosomal protein S16 [Candidatus Staskawiczbacteria bacterium]|nr:30S ribosomal protein S16 [Candidatus Staskawiczbacteria bacterium]